MSVVIMGGMVIRLVEIVGVSEWVRKGRRVWEMESLDHVS